MNWDLIEAQLQGQLENLTARLPYIIVGLGVLLAFYLLARAVAQTAKRAVDRVGGDETAKLLVGRLSFLGVLVVGLLVSASIAIPSFSLSAMVTTLGVSSVALGFALKELLENFVAGLYLLLARPYRVGDVIQVDKWEGTITHIGIRAVTIQMFNRETVLVPCARVFKEDVKIVTQEAIRRVDVAIILDHAADTAAALEVLRRALPEVALVREDPAPLVAVERVDEFGIHCRTWAFSDLREHDPRVVKSEILAAQVRGLQAAGVAFAAHPGGRAR